MHVNAFIALLQSYPRQPRAFDAARTSAVARIISGKKSTTAGVTPEAIGAIGARAAEALPILVIAPAPKMHLQCVLYLRAGPRERLHQT
jgi:hypothetical protein